MILFQFSILDSEEPLPRNLPGTGLQLSRSVAVGVVHSVAAAARRLSGKRFENCYRVPMIGSRWNKFPPKPKLMLMALCKPQHQISTSVESDEKTPSNERALCFRCGARLAFFLWSDPLSPRRAPRSFAPAACGVGWRLSSPCRAHACRSRESPPARAVRRHPACAAAQSSAAP
jgi:hypothetical protein